MDIEESVVLTKLEIAERQLDAALRLFMDERDYVSAITLAGASEEILGKLLEKDGRTHSLQEFVELCVGTGRRVFGEQWTEKHFRDMANYYRNGLKHLTDGEPLEISRDVAEDILDRAVDNYWQLTGKESPQIRRFMEEVHGW